MGVLKNILIWSNPITYIVGIPLFTGVILSAMFDGVYKKTKKIVEETDF